MLPESKTYIHQEIKIFDDKITRVTGTIIIVISIIIVYNYVVTLNLLYKLHKYTSSHLLTTMTFPEDNYNYA